ncbi:MAG: Selenocysteine-specific elongation factor [Candidatus Moanabacter tarae]|uniref:Selenocysteine-specific elongation factor n=1 Tax=Candidatus Moanibacter tarae TaxID=2200854 RepID=A0A2Z4ADL5_9BACT|nr:MAG: Selenocysteine-specific elongation factor [Candidatus Moanabacter tarae]
MTNHNLILATAGHVDHGKSSLVKALTGVDPDRLPEEKKRGLTIDLGFAFLDIRSPEDPSVIFNLGIVDVPGHEDFVKNMVAGVGSIDLCLLVIAADDGWMTQTEEHLEILSYLGISRGVVALSKSDLADKTNTLKINEIRKRLNTSRLAKAPIVRTSSVTGEGIEDLKIALGRVLKDTPLPRNIGKPRLPVDRVFSIPGIGTVATGTLTGGTLIRGQQILIQPSGIESRIRNIQSVNQHLEESRPSMRTATCLAHVSTPDSQGPTKIQKGDVVTLPELGSPSQTADALIERSPDFARSLPRGIRHLTDGSRVRIHHGSKNVPARMRFFEKQDLSPGQSTLAQLRLESPLFLFAGDRFIIRDWPGKTTVGGGIVLYPQSRPYLFQDCAHKNFLEIRAKSLGKLDHWISSQLLRDLAISPTEVLLQSIFSADEIAETIRGLAESGAAILLGPLLVERKWWDKLFHTASKAIDQEHSTNPERGGLTLSKLRRTIRIENRHKDIFEALLERLLRSGFQKQGVFLMRVNHKIALPERLRPLADKIRSSLNNKPLEPPSRKELASDSHYLETLTFLIQSNEVVEVSDKIVMSKSSFNLAKDKIIDLIRLNGPSTVSEIRFTLGTSRRIALPILEKLDHEGITLRQGDRRVLRQQQKTAVP